MASTKTKRKRSESDEKKVTITKGKVDYYDSSDEEDLRNTIGNIPVSWYDGLDHVGYDHDAKPINAISKKGQIEEFLEKMDDPDFWRKVYDRQSGGFVTLSNKQVEQLRAIGESRCPVIGYNPFQPFFDIFSSKTEIHPISNRPDSKRSFIPSLEEKRIVAKMVHAIKMGWMKPQRPKEITKKIYDLWEEEPVYANTKSERARIRMHFPAPKVPLPSHAESYNPPSEYLFSDEELKKWEETDPEDRRLDFVPRQYSCLRQVPSYERFYNDRYERCLDLYMAARQRRMKLRVDPRELLPELPNLADMRPFPTSLSFYMRGHNGQIRSVSFENGCSELFASGGADGTLRIWSTGDGRCIKTIKLESAVTSVAFCPLAAYTLVAVTLENSRLLFINTMCGDRERIAATKQYLTVLRSVTETKAGLKWIGEGEDRIVVFLPYIARQAVWHHKGDYLATFAMAKAPQNTHIHQLSKCRSQQPFSRLKGMVTSLSFHPKEPLLFLATQRHVRVYDLVKCQLKRKLLTGSRWISSMLLEGSGNNIFVAGHDRTFTWLDLQLSNKPWRSVRHHTAAIRAIAIHPKYPLVATVSDDSTAMIYYAKVSVDLLKDNEFVPVRRLRGHVQQKDGLSILAVTFHPTQPWLITAGADGTIALFS